MNVLDLCDTMAVLSSHQKCKFVFLLLILHLITVVSICTDLF